jgi:DNA-nicking Smr family endonuclease
MNAGIKEIDIHGLNKAQAKVVIDSQLKRAASDVYRLRIIHGYRGGTELRDMVRSVYRKHPKVLRISIGLNQGETDLVLREL